jgi:hypothetical protein
MDASKKESSRTTFTSSLLQISINKPNSKRRHYCLTSPLRKEKLSCLKNKECFLMSANSWTKQ